MADSLCMICEKPWGSMEEAEVCERSHAHAPPASPAPDLTGVIHRTVHGERACAFCDGDPCTCTTGAKVPEVLAPDAILRLGALTLEQERSEGVEKLLDEQEEAYRLALRRKGPEALIFALRQRDQLIAHQGRQIADGRTVSRMAREMVRASLYAAGGRPDAQAVQKAIDQFAGPEDPAGPVDARQLKLHGSTLGPLASPEQEAEKLVDGRTIARPGAVVSGGALQKGDDDAVR